MKRLAPKFVSKLLKIDYSLGVKSRQQRCILAIKSLFWSWVYAYGVNTKFEPSQWRYSGKTNKNTKTEKSTPISGSFEGIAYCFSTYNNERPREFLLKGPMVNNECYLELCALGVEHYEEYALFLKLKRLLKI